MKIRLHEKAFVGGRIHEAGETVHLPDGQKGPHRSVRTSHDHIDYDPANGIDANHVQGEMKDVPLYDVMED